MPWVICFRNEETGEIELLQERMEPDLDDQDIHIVPFLIDPMDGAIAFGYHRIKRDCICKPKIQSPVWGRTVVIHTEEVN